MKRGVLITILVLLIIIVFLALLGGYIYMQFTREPHIPENSLLQINLSGEIVDNDMSAFSKKLSIRELWVQIKRAKIDPRIKGLFLKISYLRTGYAKIEDLGRIIRDFKESKKPVYAFIEGAGARGYYLATFADKVYVFKGGELFLTGLASEAMFLKNTFSKLGIEADIFHIGEYKTAANMFTQDRMTPAHKESIEKLLEDIYQSVLEGIAANRNIPLETVKKVFEASPYSNKIYLEHKLIDGIVYEDEVVKAGKGKEKPVRISYNIYKQTTSPRAFEGMKKIAVIFAQGEIHRGHSGGKSLFGGEVLGSETVAAQLKAARKNRFVKAVVLRLDSPGGSALASDVIRREAELLAKEKPLVISMADLAASGGYWISMSSGKIMALPQTITGSIGVVAGKFVLKGLYDKAGINKEMVKTSKYAGMFTDYRKFNDDERKKLLGIMEYLYRSFLEVVAKSRNMKVEEVDKIARGRVWAGGTALNLKLVDQLGGLDEAVKEARKLAKIPAGEGTGIRIYPRIKSTLDVIMDFLNTTSDMPNPVATIDSQLSMYKKFFPAMMLPFKLSIK